MRKILLYINLFVMLSVIFPYTMLSTLVFDENVYFQYFYLLVVGFLGYFFWKRVAVTTQKNSKRLLLLIISNILLFATPFFILKEFTFLGIYSNFMFMLGRRFSINTTKQMLSKWLLLFYWGSNLYIPILCYNISGSSNNDHTKFIFMLSIISIFTRLFLLNIERIDNLSSDRGHELSDVPKQLRQHNIISVSVIFSIVILLTLFIEKITTALSNIGNWLFERFKDFLRYLVSIISDDGEYQTEVLEITEESNNIFDDFASEYSINDNNQYLDMLGYILSTIVIIWLLYKAVKIITPYIIIFIQRYLQTNASQSLTIDENEAYTQVETRIEKKYIKKKSNNQTRIWKKEYKNYIKSSNDFHKGYNLAVQGIYLYQKDINISHTPSEIANNVIIEKLDYITNIYNNSTYGEMVICQEYKDDILKVLAIIYAKI